MAEWVIGRLGDSHVRTGFSCGKAPLDRFIREQAGQYERKQVGRTYVAVERGQQRVAGYFTLAAAAVEIQHLPADVAKKLPKHPVPAVLLGRLAVDLAFRGQGLGLELLVHALRTAVLAADILGVYTVLVHAIDDDACRFYAKYGFRPFPDRPLHFFLPIVRAKATLDDLRPGNSASAVGNGPE